MAANLGAHSLGLFGSYYEVHLGWIPLCVTRPKERAQCDARG
jgi:hypothetical protein